MREGSPIFFLSMVPFFFSFPRAGLLVFFLPLFNAEDLRGREMENGNVQAAPRGEAVEVPVPHLPLAFARVLPS